MTAPKREQKIKETKITLTVEQLASSKTTLEKAQHRIAELSEARMVKAEALLEPVLV